ncbi:MAG TPA: hypothetical protein VMF06_15185 [Candidatus Limnocylindria bacterium]|nr:hypothetical protein [Candidatus Limnocylindria bacterium]
MEHTSKTFSIYITLDDPGQTRVFQKKYRVRGGDMGWYATWIEHTNLVVVLTEIPPGNDWRNAGRDAIPKQYHLLEKIYTYDEKARVFREVRK